LDEDTRDILYETEKREPKAEKESTTREAVNQRRTLGAASTSKSDMVVFVEMPWDSTFKQATRSNQPVPVTSPAWTCHILVALTRFISRKSSLPPSALVETAACASLHKSGP
jgi:hypothetical protein